MQVQEAAVISGSGPGHGTAEAVALLDVKRLELVVRLKEAFDAVDTDGSGELGPDEVIKAMERANGTDAGEGDDGDDESGDNAAGRAKDRAKKKKEKERAERKRKISSWLKERDLDGDGVITFNEFVMAYAVSSVNRERERERERERVRERCA